MKIIHMNQEFDHTGHGRSLKERELYFFSLEYSIILLCFSGNSREQCSAETPVLVQKNKCFNPEQLLQTVIKKNIPT